MAGHIELVTDVLDLQVMHVQHIRKLAYQRAELSLQGKLIASSSFKNLTVFSLVALLYLTMSVPLIFLVGRLERRFGRR